MGDYQVLLAGIKSGWDVNLAKKGLAELFAVSSQDVSQMLTRTPVVIRRGLTVEHAESFRNRVRAAGGVCRVAQIDEDPLAPSSQWLEPDSQMARQTNSRARPIQANRQAGREAAAKASLSQSTPPLSSSSVISAPKPVATCPKCNYHAFDPLDSLIVAYDGQGECPECGVVVAKYRTSLDAGAAEPDELEPPAWANRDGGVFSSRLMWSTVGGVALAVLLLPLLVMGYNQWGQGGQLPKLSQKERAELILEATAAFLAAEKMQRAAEALPVGDPFVDPDSFLLAAQRADPWGTPYRLSITGLSKPVLVTAGPNQAFELEMSGGDDLLVFPR